VIVKHCPNEERIVSIVRFRHHQLSHFPPITDVAVIAAFVERAGAAVCRSSEYI